VLDVQRQILCHHCYLRACNAAAATPPEARGFQLPSAKHASVAASIRSGALLAHEERLLPVQQLLQLEALVAAMHSGSVPDYGQLWAEVRGPWGAAALLCYAPFALQVATPQTNVKCGSS
jgi:hypothetical protein